MDVHVPLAVTEQLGMRDVDVLTVQADNTTQLEDEPLLDRASELVNWTYRALRGRSGIDRENDDS